MPFDWNASIQIIQNNGQLFVHQEIVVPRILIDPDEKPIVATVNGLALSGASIAIDQYKYENSTVFHHLINKNRLLNMSEAISKPAPSEMIFTLSHNTSEIPEFGVTWLVLAVTMSTTAAFLILARYKKVLF